MIITSVLFLILALVLLLVPASKSSFYGYRSPRANRSIEAWRYAQRYSGLLSLFFAGMNALVYCLLPPDWYRDASGLLTSTFPVLLSSALLIGLTEYALKKRFE